MVFKNRSAAFLWIFAALVMLFNAAMTYFLIRNGVPPDYSPEFLFGVSAVFWAVGFEFSVDAAGSPCVRVTVQPDGSVSAVWRYPLRTEVRELDADTLKPAEVVATHDAESDPCFYARVSLTDGTVIDLAQGPNREYCEAVCAHFNNATRGTFTPP